MSVSFTLEQVLDALPQTQCTRCGFPDCRGYAQALVASRADINQCPPGGEEGIQRLARLTGRPAKPLNPAHGLEGPRLLAVIDEAWCIGCTLCIKACPVDCIVGASKHMHTVIEADCTGCELCVPACPVDCIDLRPVDPALSGWSAWSAEQAAKARRQFEETRLRRARAEDQHRAAKDQELIGKRQDLAAAIPICNPLPRVTSILCYQVTPLHIKSV